MKTSTPLSAVLADDATELEAFEEWLARLGVQPPADDDPVLRGLFDLRPFREAAA